jgi:hypothetical protein
VPVLYDLLLEWRERRSGRAAAPDLEATAPGG